MTKPRNYARTLLKGILTGKTTAHDVMHPNEQVKIVFLEPDQQPEDPKVGERSYLIDFSDNSLT